MRKGCNYKWLGLGRFHGKVMFVRIPEEGEEVSLGDIWWKSIIGEGNSLCKGCEAGVGLVC